MFLRILKKDLKRKRTMNAILLVFVILCSMFAAASVNNIAAVTGGIEHYFNISDMPDVLVDMDADRYTSIARSISSCTGKSSTTSSIPQSSSPTRICR